MILRRLMMGLLLLTASVVHAEVNLVFGLYSNDRPSVLVRQFKPVIKELERNMTAILHEPVRIRLEITKTYEEAVQLLVDGQFDFARFGPASYITAKDIDPNIKIIALETVDNSKVFYGLLIVDEDSDITDVESIKGSSVAFGDKESTIGRYLSQQFLTNNDITADDLDTFIYLGRHDLVGEAVIDGKYDVGALKEGTYENLVERGADLRIIAKFPNVTKPWVASPKVEPLILGVMKASLLLINDPAVLKRLKIDGFTIGDDSDYNVIRDSLENNFLFFED